MKEISEILDNYISEGCGISNNTNFKSHKTTKKNKKPKTTMEEAIQILECGIDNMRDTIAVSPMPSSNPQFDIVLAKLMDLIKEVQLMKNGGY